MKVEIPGQGQVIGFYGVEKQSLVHCEELAELIQAVSKMRRVRNAGKNDFEAYENLVEEMADVLICLEQIQEIYEIPDHQIQSEITRKAARQEDRIYGHA